MNKKKIINENKMNASNTQKMELNNNNNKKKRNQELSEFKGKKIIFTINL